MAPNPIRTWPETFTLSIQFWESIKNRDWKAVSAVPVPRWATSLFQSAIMWNENWKNCFTRELQNSPHTNKANSRWWLQVFRTYLIGPCFSIILNMKMYFLLLFYLYCLFLLCNWQVHQTQNAATFLVWDVKYLIYLSRIQI